MKSKILKSAENRTFWSFIVLFWAMESYSRTSATTLWLICGQSFVAVILALYMIFRISLWAATRDERKNRAKRTAELMTSLREELLSDKILYNAFAESIKSAIGDINKSSSGMTDEELANHIADRIIGREIK